MFYYSYYIAGRMEWKRNMFVEFFNLFVMHVAESKLLCYDQ